MAKPQYVTLKAAQDFIQRYIEAGGDAVCIDEGTLGLGTVLLINNGLELKEFVIQEYYINEWSSGHKVYSFNKGLPKKWERALELYESEV